MSSAKDLRIVFMGTPEFASTSLKSLVAEGYNIVAVVTTPDKPAGRGQKIHESDVKLTAKELGLPILQPEKLRDESFLEAMRELKPDLGIVIAFRMLPEVVWAMPRLGTFNLHASLLPEYRGAAPIQWAIICGEEKTGVTIQYMDKGIDTGDIIAIREVDIKPTETADELFDRLAVVSADLMVETIEKIADGTAKRTKQNEEDASYAPIIKKEMALIDFTKTATEVYNAIRGYYSWPCAFFFLNGKRIKVTEAQVAENTKAIAGTVVSNNNELVIACGNNTAIRLISVVPEGAKPMKAAQMLLGNPIAVGTKIGE